MKKIFFAWFLVAVLVFLIPVQTLAHPGRTDGDGGHWNHSNGTYHWHHGESSHQHYDKDGDGYKEWCPYRNGGTSVGSGNSGSNSSGTRPSYSSTMQSETTKRPIWKNVIGIGFGLLLCSPIIMAVGMFAWHKVLEPTLRFVKSHIWDKK